MTVTLEQIVAHVESNNNPNAYRFEPVWYKRALEGGAQMGLATRNNILESHHGCSYYSAAVIWSSSYGRYQIMGFNLWGLLKVRVDFITYCNDTDLQDATFDDFTKLIRTETDDAGWNGKEFTGPDASQPFAPLLAFAKFYNGPGNTQNYMDRMRKIASELLAKDA